MLEKSKNLLSASANQIANDYNENQVAADQKYFKTLIRLSGKIQSINSGLGNEPYITLYGINSILLPQAHFKDGNTPKIAKLRKKQQIYLVCKGNGAVIGIPMFKDCQFAKDYAEQEITKMKLEFDDFLNGKKITSELVILPIIVIVIARSLPITSTCFSGNHVHCLIEMRGVFNGKNKKTEKIFKAVVDELKGLGIHVPDLKKLK